MSAPLRKPLYRWLRLALYGLIFVTATFFGAFLAREVDAKVPPLPWYAALVAFPLFSPLLAMLWIGSQSIGRVSDEKWALPTHDSAPFYPGNPLLVIHFFAFFAMANGAGYLVAALWGGITSFEVGIANVLIGFGLLLGLRVCIRLAGDRVVS